MYVAEALITMQNKNLFPTTIIKYLIIKYFMRGGYDLYIIPILMMPIGLA
jgi:hypothetical protein